MEKIDIVKLLVDCPEGMELDSPMCEGVTLVSVDPYYEHYPIRIKTRNGLKICLTKYGQYSCHIDSKCVIFPKGKTSWEGFTPPHQFNDGDIISDDFGSVCIFKGEGGIKGTVDFYCGIDDDANELYIKDVKDKDEHFGDIIEYNLATEEEKKKLFDTIKTNGYKWDSENKTLEKLVKPTFKVGDKIKHTGGLKATVLDVDETHYKILSGIGIIHISISLQDEWELMPNKFDIDDLKPFDKVLVRYDSSDVWRIHLFEVFVKTNPYPFICMGYNNHYSQCIPYEGNEKLLGTTNDCEEFYKTWED